MQSLNASSPIFVTLSPSGLTKGIITTPLGELPLTLQVPSPLEVNVSLSNVACCV